MQLVPSTSASGQVTYSNDFVRPAGAVSDLTPLIASSQSQLLRQLPSATAPLREVCFFASDTEDQPLRYYADVRVANGLLLQWACDDLGLNSQLWRARRILSVLPDLPSEQYVLEHVMLSWDRVLAPIDLRPLRGPISLRTVLRTDTVTQVLQTFFRAVPEVDVSTLQCYIGQAALQPSAQPFLLSWGDTLVVRARHPRGPLPSRSIARCHHSGFDRQAFADCNAVVLSDNGHFYTEAPEDFELSPEWSAFQRRTAGSLGLSGVSFRRDSDHTLSTAHVPLAIVANSTAAAVSPGEDSSGGSAYCPDSPHGPPDTSASTRKFGRYAAASWVALVTSGKFSRWALLLGFLGWVRTATGHPFLEPDPAEASTFRFEIVQAQPPRLSIDGHHHLVRSLSAHSIEHLPPLQLMLGPQVTTRPTVGVQVWQPCERHSFTVSLDRLRWDLVHKLRSTDPASQRGRPLLIVPQFEWPSLQFVAPHKDKQFVTIVADLGDEILCLDIPKQAAAQHLLEDLQTRYPSRTFRIDRGFVATIRHGDVIRIHDDERRAPVEVGQWSAINKFGLAYSWLSQGRDAYVVGPDFPLLHIPSVRPGDRSHIMAVLTHSLGLPRCNSVKLQLVSQALLEADVYCFPRNHIPCHVLIVVDALGHWRRPILQAWEQADITHAAISSLASSQQPHSEMWRALLSTTPVFLCQQGPEENHPERFAPWTLVVLDAVRAAQFGQQFTHLREPEFHLHVVPPGLPRAAEQQITIGVQTMPSYWPAHAAPVSSSSLPALPAVTGCTPLLKMCPDGSPYTLHCPHFGVCVLPCLPGFHAWGLRIGTRVFGVCTADMDWQHVLEVAEATPWDLSGMAIYGSTHAWSWPEDLQSFSGQCGHLLHTGSDPYLCEDTSIRAQPPPVPQVPSLHDPEPQGASTSGCSRFSALVVAGLSTRSSLILLSVFVFYPASSAGARLSSSSGNESSDVTVYQNSTRTCTMSWCHELSCQTTHFEVSPAILSDVLQQQAPHHIVRVQLWLPYRSPVTLELQRADSGQQIAAMLQAAGHSPAQALHVAFDTSGTTLDLLSVPRSHVAWWIVRDGLGRELLRPVTRWTEPGHCFVLTLNSHGQAHALTYSPEAADLAQLPQGVRAVVTTPFPHIAGQMTSHGLVLMEFAAGTASLAWAAALPTRLGLLAGLLLCSVRVAGMQQQQDLAVRSASAAASAADPWTGQLSEPPVILRIWSHTGVRPLDVPYCPMPDPRWMTRCIADSGRGFPPFGDFVWTQPTIIQGVAHMLHVPSRAVPPFSFWLLHYRARGHVVASPAHIFDWAQIGGEARDAFGGTCFSQGSFGIFLQGRIYPSGGHFPVPPHGAVLHLVRTPVFQSTGQTLWDSHQDNTPLPPFDYDICLGSDGTVALTASRPPPQQPSVTPASRPANSTPARVSEGPTSLTTQEAGLARHLASVAHSLNLLTARLESAGVLPADPVDGGDAVTPWPREGDDEAPTSHSSCRSPTFTFGRLLCALGCFSGVLPASVRPLCSAMCLGFVEAAGDGEHSADEADRSGPSQPVSPDMPDDFRAPTPERGIASPEPGRSLVRPSNDVFAATGVPGSDSLRSEEVTFQAALLPVYQRRVTCALQGILDTEHSHPFLPAGCPFIVHNPFTGRSQCRLISGQHSSERAFLRMIHDHAARRGWQPIVAVQPQPDAQAIHLIPSAADESLATVLLQGQGVTQPVCLARSLHRGQSRSVQHNGRAGRVVAPYADRRHPSRTLHLRDGDCLQVNHGPFGPPAPTPVHSSAYSRRIHAFAAIGVALRPRGAVWIVSLLAFHYFRIGLPMQRAGQAEPIGKPIYQLSSFPWRLPEEQRDAQLFCDRRQCRYTLVCPWTGTHGVHTADSRLPLTDIWRRYSANTPGWPHQRYYPIWPGPRHHIISLLPWPPSPHTVCIAVRQAMNIRALVLPASISFDNLCRAIQCQTAWDIGEVRLPPAVFAAYSRATQAQVELRTGDVLEILGSRADRYVARLDDQALIHSCAMWTQGIRFLRTFLLRLWNPDWPRPIITWLHPDTEWLPESLTFSGHFAETYPGRWVPIPWSPSRVLQFMRVSDTSTRAHILFEDHAETRAIALISPISPAELAEELHTETRALQVVGADCSSPHQSYFLRDGDILHDSLLGVRPVPSYGWPDDADNPYEYRLPVNLALPLLCRRGLGCLLAATLIFSQTAGASPDFPAPRSRSRSSADPVQGTNSPRVGRFRPEVTQPFAEVVSSSRMHYQEVLCPFRGWGPPAYGLRDTQLPTLTHVMHQWSATWAPYPVVIGGTSDLGPTIILPGGLPSLAIVVVLSPGVIQSTLLPRVITYRRLAAALRPLVPVEATLLRLPPSLRTYQQLPDTSLRLRDGDCFELCVDSAHSAFRPSLPVPEFPFGQLPHLSVWHAPFRVSSSGWIYLWSPQDEDADSTRSWEARWVSRGELWSPASRQFHRPGALPGLDRWVPAAWVTEGELHFVRQSEPGEASVLRADRGSQSVLGCIQVSNAAGEFSTPAGWVLRPDLRVRAPMPQLRDGDVIVAENPDARRRVHRNVRAPVPVAGLASFCSRLRAPAFLLGLLWLASLGQAMPLDESIPHQNPEPAASVRVGCYSWRVPNTLRACNRTVDPGHKAVYLSPFSGCSEPITVHPDTRIATLRAEFAFGEPPWADDITPVWPAPHSGALTFVPAAPAPSLAVIVVLSTEWQAAYLVPRRSDASWLLSVLRRGSEQPIHAIRPPIAANQLRHTDSDSIDWRDGDVVLAFPYGDVQHYSHIPSFDSAAQVRHSALWAHDFEVTCPLPVVVWMPGIWPVRTEMPGHARWHAASQTFLGHFSRRFPGQWVPVQWISSDEVHVCLQDQEAQVCNIVIERSNPTQLLGYCRRVYRWASLDTLSVQFGTEGAPLVRLGASSPESSGPLRDGDVLHFVTPDASATFRPTPGWRSFLCLICLGHAGLRGSQIIAVVVGLLGTLPHAEATFEAALTDDGARLAWVWSPFRGKLGPIGDDRVTADEYLTKSEPWWAQGVVLARPSLSLSESHWVPRSPSRQFVVILVNAAPQPRAALLPRQLSKAALRDIVGRHCTGHFQLCGQLPELAEDHPPHVAITLRNGDVLTIVPSRWQPTIFRNHRQHFHSHAAARTLGCWSHHLTFDGDCWLLLWRPHSEHPEAVFAQGRQVWDPTARTLRPALWHFPDGWWPSLAGLDSDQEPLHLVLADDDGRSRVTVLQSQPWRCEQIPDPYHNLRTGEVLPSGLPQSPYRGLPTSEASATENAARRPHPLYFLGFGLASRHLRAWQLSILACYLAALGSPDILSNAGPPGRDLVMTQVAALTARLHSRWWNLPLRQSLPLALSCGLRQAWHSFPKWTGSVPDSILIAADGSGRGDGTWAFVAWGHSQGRWHRIGWEADQLASTSWLPASLRSPPAHLASFHGELAALMSAGLWLAAMTDWWQLHMGARPRLATIAVDNSAALQIAAGQGRAVQASAELTRYAWQAVQSRLSTNFRHVHSHTGVLCNTLADALAEQAAGAAYRPNLQVGLSFSEEDFCDHFPWLWLLPHCVIKHGQPVCPVALPDLALTPPASRPHSPRAPGPAPAPAPPPLHLHVMTANIQTIKDANPCIFNPSGIAARRQYLYTQVQQLRADIVCLQETRSRAGRWPGPGLLTWRSGAFKGQYGCEVWVRADVTSVPLTLQDWKILVSTPRVLCVTCSAEAFPVSIISAHAPHADRPDAEARRFWQEITSAVHRVPAHRALVLGLDANGDFHAADPEHALIGELPAAGEPGRNDDMLLEFCVVAGLEAPGTCASVQLGPGWSWQHTSGRQKRLDHLLFRPGPWEHHHASQAFDFDIVNQARDHVALRVRSTLTLPRSAGFSPRPRRATGPEATQIGARLWPAVNLDPTHAAAPAGEIARLTSSYATSVRNLPARPKLCVRQPYLRSQTVHALHYLRDWRVQLRVLQRNLRLTILSAVLAAWKGNAQNVHAAVYQQRLVLGAYTLQERKLQNQVHDKARSDKIRHMTQLTAQACEAWHATGQPMSAIVHLKWASRRAADRRGVFAAGGYDINDALEEQFRLQEGGQLVTEGQLQAKFQAWAHTPTTGCPQAMPTLLDLEQGCLRQKCGKAPGPDTIPNELWRQYPQQAGRWLWRICTQTALSGREPPNFKKALQCALYKKGPASLPSNYRSIALLNGLAKIWHGHIRGSLGLSLLARYDPLQLGGRKHIPVAFAVASFRNTWDLSVQQGRCVAALFVDIQAAYYETSRQLLFAGDAAAAPPEEARLAHLAALAHALAQDGALSLLGAPKEEIDLLHDCVACSHWQLVGSSNTFLATRGSRPGDGLADILFGALFSIGLRHIRKTCALEGIAHLSSGELIGRPGEVVPIGWADDLAVLADFAEPRELELQLPRLADIVISTLEFLRFRVNLGPGKTEAIIDVRGSKAKAVRGSLLAGDATLPLPGGRTIRLAPEYRYLGVLQLPRDTGRRDQELSVHRAQAAWAQARGLLTSASLPWPLKQAWIVGRILPAAYATVCTSIAVSQRATAPLEGFFERATRTLLGSWRFDHHLTKPSLYALAGLTAPTHAAVIGRVRLVLQLCAQAPPPVWDIFEAAWNRDTGWCSLLTDACRRLLPAAMHRPRPEHVTLSLVRLQTRAFSKACKHLSRYGTTYWAFWALWRDVIQPRVTAVLGVQGHFLCPMCQKALPSKQALAAHLHRKHSILNFVTRFTCGTICLWCNTDHFSTDRLKYHLRTTPLCMHGLRVVVGASYSYGTGSKRVGAGGHRGVPPQRLPGPLNATPAERRAAAELRHISDEERSAELFQTVGVRDVYQWSATQSVTLDNLCDAPSQPPNTDAGTRVWPQLGDPHDGVLHWRCFCDADHPLASEYPSPFWSGLEKQATCWGLPRAWHSFWHLWSTLEETQDPWDSSVRRDLRRLRNSMSQPATGPAAQTVSLLANTITFRLVCHCVSQRGMLWIPGVPSTRGILLLRKLLPQANFQDAPSVAGRVFVVSHASCDRTLEVPRLQHALSVQLSSVSPFRMLRPSLVYRARSLDS